MAYEFNGATKAITYRSVAMPTALTLMGWLVFNSTGSATNPEWFRHSQSRVTAGMRNSKADLDFERAWTNQASWRCTAANAVVALTSWFFVAWRYDGASSANAPTCWTGNLTTTPASRTVTTSTAPTGTRTSSAGVITIGNNDTSANNWGAGSIAWVSYHNAILTDAEVLEAWAYGWSSRSLASAQLVAPLIGSPENYSGVVDVGTVTAATVVPGPSIAPYGLWTPRGGGPDSYKEQVAAAAAAAASSRRTLLGVGV